MATAPADGRGCLTRTGYGVTVEHDAAYTPRRQRRRRRSPRRRWRSREHGRRPRAEPAVREGDADARAGGTAADRTGVSRTARARWAPPDEDRPHRPAGSYAWRRGR